MCECEEPTEFVKVKFIGGAHRKGRARGPYSSYNTGKIYVMPKRYANSKAYPYWEFIAEACEDEIPEFWKKRMEEGMKKAESFFPSPTEAVLLKGDEAEEKSEPSSKGLTKVYGVATPDGIKAQPTHSNIGEIDEQRLMALPDDVLRAFITNNTGKEPDGRWGREKLLEQAKGLL